jgi:lactate dehydrogenase-like 2-hydroxyacid dehydrogenase
VWLWDEDRPIPGDRLGSAVGTASGLYCMLTDTVDEQLLNAAPDLRVVSTMSVGTDHIDLAACTARSIPVGHTPEVLNETTADTAFALLMAAARRLGEGRDYVRAGEWQRWEPDLLLGYDVHGSTLGIIGLGRVGQAIARRGLGFGMRVLYTARRRRPEAEAGLGVLYRDLDDLLAESDHVVVATPLTSDTAHLIDGAALARMKSTATLVNISRGGTVDSAALVNALQSGEIAAAGLDVTDPEPIPADHPLVHLDNCFVIPHLGSSSRATRQAMADLAADNLLAGLCGESLPACANPEVYR